MTFTVSDLMIDVRPGDADAQALRLCSPVNTQPDPKAPPPPKPPKPEAPQCLPITSTGVNAMAQGGEEVPELASLAFLREQLRQALHC